MTTFIDGPAKGQCLKLLNSPDSLRVVEKDGKWDALDDPEDIPRPGETIYQYRISKRFGTVHLNMGRWKGGFYPIAEYEFVQ